MTERTGAPWSCAALGSDWPLGFTSHSLTCLSQLPAAMNRGAFGPPDGAQHSAEILSPQGGFTGKSCGVPNIFACFRTGAKKSKKTR